MLPADRSGDPVPFDKKGWIQQQLDRYGAVVGGEALRSLLGFNTLGAFRQARVTGMLGVRVFHLPARRGHFALTAEVCAWLLVQREQTEEGR